MQGFYANSIKAEPRTARIWNHMRTAQRNSITSTPNRRQYPVLQPQLATHASSVSKQFVKRHGK